MRIIAPVKDNIPIEPSTCATDLLDEPVSGQCSAITCSSLLNTDIDRVFKESCTLADLI